MGCSLFPKRCITKYTSKMGLNKKEIAVIATTNRGNYSVEIKTGQDDLWQVVIKLPNPDRHFDIVTSRGELKTWRNLADAITFIQETCADCMNVEITVQTWTFVRRG